VCQRCANCDWYVAGITLFGRECETPESIGVYTNVAFFESWIAEITNQVIEPEPLCIKPSEYAQ